MISYNPTSLHISSPSRHANQVLCLNSPQHSAISKCFSKKVTLWACCIVLRPRLRFFLNMRAACSYHPWKNARARGWSSLPSSWRMEREGKEICESSAVVIGVNVMSRHSHRWMRSSGRLWAANAADLAEHGKLTAASEPHGRASSCTEWDQRGIEWSGCCSQIRMTESVT
jgi:hypothetical protein